ncbi:hypothetical protein ACLOJK_013660 [Asimina triloba]
MASTNARGCIRLPSFIYFPQKLARRSFLPPSVDPTTGVSSKDVDILPELGVKGRLYLPRLTGSNQKLPILVHYHGGAFCIESAFSSLYHPYLNSLVAEANVVAVSVNYRKAPKHRLPAAYNDSWAALQWVASHSEGGGTEGWLQDHADFTRLFVGGDSAGANISHQMAARAGTCEIGYGVKILGAILVHPFFWGTEAIGKEAKLAVLKVFVDALWWFVYPSMASLDDPFINPVASRSRLSMWACERVLVCVAEKDLLRDRGWLYYRWLEMSGWEGSLDGFETKGEGHVFHLFNPTSDPAIELMKLLVDFINR